MEVGYNMRRAALEDRVALITGGTLSPFLGGVIVTHLAQTGTD